MFGYKGFQFNYEDVALTTAWTAKQVNTYRGTFQQFYMVLASHGTVSAGLLYAVK